MRAVTVAPVAAEEKEKQLRPSCSRRSVIPPYAEHRTHPVICHHMLLTQVLDLGVPIMVLLSCTGTLTGIAGGLADGRPSAGEDYAPLAGGFPNRLLPRRMGWGGCPGCHPSPRCDRCHPIAQSGAWTLGLRLPETADVGTRASRLRWAANLRASAPLASRSGGVFPGEQRGLVIQGTQ